MRRRRLAQPFGPFRIERFPLLALAVEVRGQAGVRIEQRVAEQIL
jgi:hypothetical protein